MKPAVSVAGFAGLTGGGAVCASETVAPARTSAARFHHIKGRHMRLSLLSYQSALVSASAVNDNRGRAARCTERRMLLPEVFT